MDDAPLTSEELRHVRKLIEIEKIRKKRVLYSQYMDGGDLDGFANLYTEDAVADWGPHGSAQGRKGILEKLKRAAGKPEFNFMHMTADLWIELTGPDSATSRCYLHDISTEPHPNISPTLRYGIYEDDWVKQGDDWMIKHARVFFLWPTRHAPEKFATPLVPTSIG